MPWFKVDDNLGFHHKVIAAGNPAMGLWVRAGSVCAQQLTDGFVPDHMIAAMGTTAQAKRLVTVGLWDRVRGGYRFHGWAERQPSKADVEAERAAAKERMREYRAKKKGTAQKAEPQVSGVRSEDVQPNERRTNAEVRDVFGDPDPTHPDPTHPDPPIEEPAATPRKRPATRLPESWHPTDTHYERAANGIDVQREADTFRAHAEANDRRCVNWNAAFTQWLLKARPGQQSAQSRSAEWFASAQRLHDEQPTIGELT